MLKSRALRWALGALAALLLLWALAWLALPPLLKWQLETRGSQLLGRELRVAKVEFVPTSLALTLHGLSIAAAPGADATLPQLQIERLFMDIDARSLWRLAPVLEALEIDAPRLRLTRLSPGHYDIDDLLQRFGVASTPPTDTEPARFALFNLRLAGGEIDLDDRPVARKHALRNLRLDLPFLSNLPDDLQVEVEPKLAFVLNGSVFDSHGQSTPFAQGRASTLNFRFDKLELNPLWVYVPKTLPVQPAGGTLSADLNLRFEQPATGAPRVDLNGQIALDNLAFNAGDAQVLAWKGLRIGLADVRPLQRQVWLDAVQLDGAVMQVRRDASGSLEFERLAAAFSKVSGSAAAAPAPPVASAASAAPSTSATAQASAATATPDWQFRLKLLELNAAQLHWSDAAVTPAAHLQLDGLQLRLSQLRWPVESDATLVVDAQLRAADKALGALHADGTLSDRQAKLALRLEDIDLAAAAPYLRAHLQPQLSARLHAVGEFDWAWGEQPRQLLVLSSLRVDDVLLSDGTLPLTPATQTRRPAQRAKPPPITKQAKGAPDSSGARGVPARGVLLKVAQLELAPLRVDLLQQQVAIGSLSIQRPFIDVVRDASGGLNLSRWATEAAPTGAAPAAPAVAPPLPAQTTSLSSPWQVALRQFKLEGGRVRFSDAALPAGPMELDSLRVSAQELAWPLLPGAAPLATQLSARLLQNNAAAGGRAATPARLDWNGRIALQPASARGKLLVERFPVHVFEPYFGATLPLTLQRLEAGFKGELDLRQLKSGPSGQVRGEALLADLSVTVKDRAVAVAGAAPGTPPRELLSWSAVHFGDFALTLPAQGKPLLEIGTLRLSDYFSHLEITEEGRLNLQTVAAPAPGSAAPAAAAASATPAAGSANAAPQISAPSAMLSHLPIDLVVGATQIENARVDFNDRFVRPNYSAQLSDLNGSVGRLDSRTRDLATLQVKGRVAGTGVLEIGGSINPTVSPPALDITAKASDIELPALTPYSSKYAGYPIERGKLSVDIAYKIESDGKLDARNQIIVNQLTLGPKSDSPDATKLPVRLAVALLQDRHGVIDLDLPLTGSINDPQFSVWALVWKVLGNLIGKAVTAPFAMIGGAGGKDLSAVEFEPGTARIAPASQDGIDKVAKALNDRPGLKLNVVGQSDPVSEKQAMQRAAVESRLLDEVRREKGRSALGSGAIAAAPASAPAGTAADMAASMSAEERQSALKRLYADTNLPGKPRNLVGMSKDIPAAEMQAMLEAATPVDAATARQLAVQRGRIVREALIAKGLGSERLFLGEAKLRPEETDNAAWTPHAQLTLSAN